MDYRNKEPLRRLYYDMLRIRMVERHIESLYHLDEMKTPIHLCIGQEAVSVGVCAALEREDTIQSNHRGHGHYLAKGGDLPALIAELYCRETGCSKGRGGSMHLVDASVGHLGSSSIVGGGIPIGTGMALAAMMLNKRQVCAVFFGDGAADEGVLYESLNFAMLKRLPCVFVYENNQWSVCSHVTTRQPCASLFHRLDPEFMSTALVDGNDVVAVYKTSCAAVARARSGGGPSFIECKTYRVRGHAGAYSDADLGYRTQEEITEWEDGKCPIQGLRAKALADEILTEADLATMEQEIAREISDAFAYAQKSPLPSGDDLERFLYKE